MNCRGPGERSNARIRAALLECGSRTQAQRKIANQPTKHYRRSTARPGWPIFRADSPPCHVDNAMAQLIRDEQVVRFGRQRCGHVTPRRLRPGKRPGQRGALKISRSKSQAATLVGATSRTLPELTIGIARGFMASGTSRTRSTCRSPFAKLALLTTT